VHIGNGTSLKIHHIGTTNLFCSRFSKLVILNDFLHFSFISKTSLNVSHIIRDNGVVFEFYPDFCTIKTQSTKDIVL